MNTRPIETVLFDLHNTTMDGSYAAVGITHVSRIMASRWGVDADAAFAAFMPNVSRAMRTYAERDFYLMRDVFLETFRGVASDLGIELSDDDLAELDREMWDANYEAAQPVEGAIETFDQLRGAGIKVGIVSWADEAVFDRLIERLGFTDHIDIAVCSETARSCKPHPGIFRWALDALGAEPATTMFVGDNVDGDIVGGNRLGMTTVLVQGTEFSDDLGASAGEAEAIPDHRATSLFDVADIALAAAQD